MNTDRKEANIEILEAEWLQPGKPGLVLQILDLKGFTLIFGNVSVKVMQYIQFGDCYGCKEKKV